MPKHLLYIVFILLYVPVIGQQAGLYTFTHYTTSSGLISNQINTVTQDQEGFIWMGTTDGLQRFDGIRYKSFRHKDNDITTIPSNAISQLLVDTKKNLWILNADGKVGIFNTKRFTYREVPLKVKSNLALRTPVKRLISDEFGNVFLLLGGHEVVTWNETAHELSFTHNFFLGDKDWSIADFTPQPGTQKYWMSIQGGGIAVYNHANRQLSYAGNNVDGIRAIDKFERELIRPSQLHFDKKGRLWFNTWGPGISYTHCYDLRKNEFILAKYSFLPALKTYYETRGFFEQRDGTVWIKGVKVFARYLEKEKKFEQVYNGYETERGIAYRVITSLFEDRENNIWVGTGNNGLFLFNPSREIFTNIKHINPATGNPGDGSPLSFAQEKNGNLLVGYWGDGLFRYDKNLIPIPLRIKGIPDKNFFSIWDMVLSKDSQTIWMAAQPGVYAYNQETRSAEYYNPPALQNRTIREIIEDRNGNLWLGTQSAGIFRWDAGKGKKRFDQGLSKFAAVADVQVNKLIVDKTGYLWVATSGEGAYVIDPVSEKLVMHFHKNAAGEQKLAEENVSSLLEYNDSIMVITTSTRVFLYNKTAKKTILLADAGFISGYISSMEKDRAGYLWISTTSAIYRININKKIFVSFNRNDGIFNDYFVLASSHTLPDGRMLFGSSAQFVVFDPGSILINKDGFPQVVITDFKVMNKYLPVDSLLQLKRVELGPEENSLDIEFSYLKYIKDHAIRYKLENLDKNWRIADESHRALYSYLPPGTYTLLLTTINAEGNADTNITRLVIRINPPFWKTWWFFCLLALAIASVFYWLDKQRINRLIAMQRVRTEIASNLHEDVNSTLNNINLLSEMARIKADKDIDRSKEYIDQISTKSHDMIIAMDDILWSIDPENDSMEKSLLRMMEFADSLKNQYGAVIEIALDKKVKSLNLDMKTRHEAFLVFKQALRMIVTYSGGQNTLVHIDFFKNKLSVKLRDDTASLDKNITEIDDSIKDMHARASQIGADLDVQYDENGIAVLLLVPVK